MNRFHCERALKNPMIGLAVIIALGGPCLMPVNAALAPKDQADPPANSQPRLTPEQRRQNHQEAINRRQERLKERRSEFENRLFEEVDQDRDGIISKSEFRKRADRRFQELDLNRDGKLSRDELRQERPAPRHP